MTYISSPVAFLSSKEQMARPILFSIPFRATFRLMLYELMTIIFFLLTASAGYSQTVQYADLVKGGKLPYGKNVTLTGKLSDLKCGAIPLTNLLTTTEILASYLGQTNPATIGSISGDTWSVPLGPLPADNAINLTLKVTGKIAATKQTAIVNDLMNSDAFERELEAFVVVTTDQGPAVVNQEAEQLLSNITAPNGALTTILQQEVPCVTVTDVTNAALVGLRANLIDFIDLSSRLNDLTNPALGIRGLKPGMLPGDLYQLIVTRRDELKTSPSGLQPAADTALDKFKGAYEKVLSIFQTDVVAQLSAGVQMQTNTVTSDFAKYAGFDVGAIDIPKINELRQFLIVNIYPFGPVDLDTNNVALVDWRSRFSLALGASVGDLSSNSKSSIKGNSAFIYGVGYRLNKYFRLSFGGAVYRDASTNKLLNEAFVGPSVDITALPGLKQIFASATGKSNSTTSNDQSAQDQQSHPTPAQAANKNSQTN